MRFLNLAGRVLFALIFVVAAPRHFTHEGIQHAADLGVPFATLLVPASGFMAFLGGISVAAGFRARWGAFLLIAFLIPVTFMMHAFWKLSDPALIHIQRAMFLKNLSMLGAAAFLLCQGAGPGSVDNLRS